MDTHTQQDSNNPINWEGENKTCSECTEELTMNDYSNICNNCFNKEEEETEFTCCGDEVKGITADIRICPTCKEHI